MSLWWPRSASSDLKLFEVSHPSLLRDAQLVPGQCLPTQRKRRRRRLTNQKDVYRSIPRERTARESTESGDIGRAEYQGQRRPKWIQRWKELRPRVSRSGRAARRLLPREVWVALLGAWFGPEPSVQHAKSAVSLEPAHLLAFHSRSSPKDHRSRVQPGCAARRLLPREVWVALLGAWFG